MWTSKQQLSCASRFHMYTGARKDYNKKKCWQSACRLDQWVTNMFDTQHNSSQMPKSLSQIVAYLFRPSAMTLACGFHTAYYTPDFQSIFRGTLTASLYNTEQELMLCGLITDLDFSENSQSPHVPSRQRLSPKDIRGMLAEPFLKSCSTLYTINT